MRLGADLLALVVRELVCPDGRELPHGSVLESARRSLASFRLVSAWWRDVADAEMCSSARGFFRLYKGFARESKANCCKQVVCIVGAGTYEARPHQAVFVHLLPVAVLRFCEDDMPPYVAPYPERALSFLDDLWSTTEQLAATLTLRFSFRMSSRRDAVAPFFVRLFKELSDVQRARLQALRRVEIVVCGREVKESAMVCACLRAAGLDASAWGLEDGVH